MSSSRHLLITGASSGIGRAIALRLAGPNTTVSLLSRRLPQLEETVALVGASGHSACAFSCDVQDADSIRAAFANAATANGPIHGLIAAAGIGGSNSPGEDDRFDALVSTNLTGTYRCIRALEEHLAPGPDPRHVVIIASILARFGVAGYTGYCASKAALLGLTRAYALEVASKNVLVNAICPGWVDTDMAWDGIDGMASGMGVTRAEAHRIAMSAVPLGRMGKPEEVAGLVAFLLSTDAACMTGQGLDPNGGAWM